MAARKAAVTQVELKRTLSACRDVGLAVSRVEISRDGKVVIYLSGGGSDDGTANPWDKQ
ncbi:MAG: hypothetical protein KGH84_03885 [Paracoccaceae bacterium]|nr:hypothetical protein [Paracoccaceae bacterium]